MQYIDARLDRISAHYDQMLGLYGKRMEEIDERHLILQQELVANVWDADEAWTVVWYEDGERRGPMARRIGFDPVSLRIHPGDELPPRRIV